MSRSIKKGPYIEASLEKRILAMNKNGKKDEPELETCFEALYGVLLLRLQKKPISEGTAKAVEAITSFLSMLANYYDKDRKGELKLDE